MLWLRTAVFCGQKLKKSLVIRMANNAKFDADLWCHAYIIILIRRIHSKLIVCVHGKQMVLYMHVIL
jgi:hypothetical protein